MSMTFTEMPHLEMADEERPIVVRANRRPPGRSEALLEPVESPS